VSNRSDVDVGLRSLKYRLSHGYMNLQSVL
jgi:hypothetical protein